MQREYPILEFDPSQTAIVQPGAFSHVRRVEDVPEHCVICFFPEVIAQVVADHTPALVKNLRSEIGKHPVYVLNEADRRTVFFHPGVGAPLAVALLEEVIALGCRKFIACGSAGVLNAEIAVGHLVVPSSAVRDEGVSYHYLPPSREAAASPEGVAAIEATLRANQVDYILGKTWTTDAIYRETAAKVALRRSEGCITVEMEAASFFACAHFRQVTFAQILYGGDDVSGDAWDHRHWSKQISTRERLFWLSVEACHRL